MRRQPDTTFDSQAAASRGPFRAFRNVNYTRLWGSNALMYTTRWMQMILLAWLTLELTEAPWLVALVGFFSMLPTLVLGLFGGLLADRADRYWLLVITQGVSTAVSALMTLVLLLGWVYHWICR
ncbi:MFS transporter [Candidatus Entotheonella palauensis]|uniref:MFS transporter n=1 Tax=Candidatus Entotheonella palauensis TaxID=93172 RepID=UPI000B7E4320|nr:MFS transporter [Candidatus Entotheonella palauensis]